MREWWVIYHQDHPAKNIPDPVCVASGTLEAPDYGGFIETANAGQHDGRDLIAMWIVELSPQERIIVWCGKHPPIGHQLDDGTRVRGKVIKDISVRIPMMDRRAKKKPPR